MSFGEKSEAWSQAHDLEVQIGARGNRGSLGKLVLDRRLGPVTPVDLPVGNLRRSRWGYSLLVIVATAFRPMSSSAPSGASRSAIACQTASNFGSDSHL